MVPSTQIGAAPLERPAPRHGGIGSMHRRSYGSGSLYVREDANGRKTWYGKWRANGRQIKRKVGPKRADGSREGLTRPQAEAELRRLMGETEARSTVGERLTVQEAARHYLTH